MVMVRRWTGRESRALRQAMRLSVRDFSANLGVATRTVTKWEADGVHAHLRPDSHALLDTAYHHADDRVQARFAALLAEEAPAPPGAEHAPGGRHRPGRVAPSGRTVESQAHPPPVPPVISGWGSSHESEDEDVRRRTFVRAFASAGTAGVLAMSGIEALRHELVATVHGEPADLVDWDAVAWDYGLTYATTPPSVLLNDLTTDLFVARERLDRLTDDRMRAGMLRVIAQLSVFMAHTLAGMGNVRAGCRWWRVARSSAADCTDPEVRMWVVGREVIGGLYEPRPLDGLLALAEEAATVAEMVPGMGTGSVLIGRAQVLAVLGRESEATQAIAQVYAVFDRLPSRVTGDVDSLYGWPEHRFRHGESYVYSHLGEARKAVAAQERALTLYPRYMLRERAQIQLHQALCMVKCGDYSGGARHAGQVLADLPDEQRTEVVLEVARSVAHAVPAGEQLRSGVVELRELLALPAAAGR